MNKALKWTLILIPVALGGYVIYGQVKRYQASKTPGPPLLPEVNPVSGCTFPMKKGSIGPCVQSLQAALMVKYGKSILPKYGADGSWGAETDGAVKSAAGTIVINSQADYEAIMKMLQN